MFSFVLGCSKLAEKRRKTGMQRFVFGKFGSERMKHYIVLLLKRKRRICLKVYGKINKYTQLSAVKNLINKPLKFGNGIELSRLLIWSWIVWERNVQTLELSERSISFSWNYIANSTRNWSVWECHLSGDDSWVSLQNDSKVLFSKFSMNVSAQKISSETLPKIILGFPPGIIKEG